MERSYLSHVVNKVGLSAVERAVLVINSVYRWLERIECGELLVEDLWESMVARGKGFIEEGKAAGEFTSSIPTGVMIFSFFSMFSPKVYDRMLLGEDLSREELVKHLWCIYVNGIANHKD